MGSLAKRDKAKLLRSNKKKDLVDDGSHKSLIKQIAAGKVPSTKREKIIKASVIDKNKKELERQNLIDKKIFEHEQKIKKLGFIKKDKQGMTDFFQESFIIGMSDIEIKYKDRIPEIKKALDESGGFVSIASRKLQIPPYDLNLLIDKNDDLRSFVYNIRESFVDEAEQSLRSLVNKQNLNAVIFTLKCLGQNRGYIDAPKIDVRRDAPIVINLVPASSDVSLPRNLPALNSVCVDNDDEDDDAIDAEYTNGEI